MAGGEGGEESTVRGRYHGVVHDGGAVVGVAVGHGVYGDVVAGGGRGEESTARGRYHGAVHDGGGVLIGWLCGGWRLS